MRNYLCLAFCLITGLLSAQTVDSVALRRVDSLIRVSQTLAASSNFDQALEVNALAEKIALEKLGRLSASFGRCALNHGRISYFKGDMPEAEKWWLEAREIREKVLGKENPVYASSLHNLGVLYEDMGNIQKAESFYLEAMAIRERALGKEHPDYATSLNSLGIIYMDMGQYEKAEQLYLRAKTIWGKSLGKKHPNYAKSLNNLAILYENTGKFEQAELLYLEALDIAGKSLGKEHPDYATNLNNLASLYLAMGDFDKAEQLFLETKAIWGKALGKEHTDYARCLNNLAVVYKKKSNYDKAEQLYLEAKEIYGKALGKEHPYYAESLNNLAGLYGAMGQYEKAEPLLLEAKTIWGKALGKEHPDYAKSLSNLAIVYGETGNYEKAEALYLEAKAIYGKVLGRENPEYAENLKNLAILYSLDMGEQEKAEPLYLELSQINRHLAEKAMHHLSEREMNSFLNEFSDGLDNALAFVRRSASPKRVSDCFDNALFYKGFLLNAANRSRTLVLSNPAAAENFNLLKSYERRLAAQYAQPVADRDSTSLADLEAKANNLEKDLARTVAGFGQALRQVKWQEIQKSLKPGEAAIEFVSYRFYRKKQTDSMLYAALVLLPGTDAPKFIPLFEEKQLTTLLKTEGNPQPAFYNDLYAAAKKGDQLYNLIWKSISAALPQGTTVYCSPSGLLHRINLGAIPTPDGKTLAEKHRLSTLGSTRQLVVPPVPTTQQSATAQLYGGIQYDAIPTVAANTPLKLEDLAAQRGLVFTQNDSTLRGENWNYLRWTEVEISAAANVMKSKGITPTLKKGIEATEESFKALGQGSPSPRVLHLATHGFFFPDPKESKSGEVKTIGEKTFKVSNNPMIRSGLVLAGGNHAWKTGKPLRPGLEDGILTAYEISQMNLANTELVVLSACETGLGDLVGNEGVYGLQRAFKIAGARYLIMSLWQVPDFQTQVFMTAFYKHWLEDKKTVPEAFRATQTELRGRYSGEAFKWAGFVLVE
ncbi:tetratricopeptide repeat protein [Haliscomenobacter sp.]|uniref:tetratricopeptide repeat protein n=1 Tax=Haliscomenobacter sp. TaxID=2717303 RepID=UPI003BABB67F